MATAKPQPMPVAGPESGDAATPPDLPLAAPLRLNLLALDIDAGASDFGEGLCRRSADNEPYDFEISATGELIAMPPSGWERGANEQAASSRLAIWQDDNGSLSFSLTVMFNLPNGARCIPDASWITQEGHEQLLSQEYRSAIDDAPDFVMEVRSHTDNLADGLARIEEGMGGGARPGWYRDPCQTRADIFRPGQPVETLNNPEALSGEDVLPCFGFEAKRLRFAGHGQLSGNGD